MSDSNYSAFEDNVIGTVRQMAFEAPIICLFMTGILYIMLCWMLFIVIYIWYTYTFQKFACLPSGDKYSYCFVPYEL